MNTIDPLPAEGQGSLYAPPTAAVEDVGDGFRVELTSALFADLKAVLGPSCVGLGAS